MLTKKQAIASFCMLLLFTSCYWIPCNFTSSLKTFKTEQKEDFFVGEYVVEKFINGGNINTSQLSIKINKDKTVEIINIPKYILDLRENEDKINNGLGKYLNPINYHDPNFWENTFTGGLGTHGITSSTKLTPTY